ncbi:MAG: hypothetical protein ACRDOH_08855 [Streptosporangiaceae bacterium]
MTTPDHDETPDPGGPLARASDHERFCAITMPHLARGATSFEEAFELMSEAERAEVEAILGRIGIAEATDALEARQERIAELDDLEARLLGLLAGIKRERARLTGLPPDSDDPGAGDQGQP